MKIVYEARYEDKSGTVKHETFVGVADADTIAKNMIARAKDDGRTYLDFFNAVLNCFPSECAFYVDDHLFDQRIGTLVPNFSARDDEELLGVKIMNKDEMMNSDEVLKALYKYFRGAQTIYF